MQKIIVDTNVVVSALIANAVPAKILYELVLTQSVEICLTTEVFEEYIEVLQRDKFNRFTDFKRKADVVLSKIKDISKFYQTDKKIEILTDTSDNKFLELAAVSAADYLVTGNTLDFTMTEFEYTRIVTPREYWDNFRI